MWYQVNSGQEIWVIGTILEDKTVRGGTGWGAEFAKLCNKKLHVFDQERKELVLVERRGLAGARQQGWPSHHACPLHRHRHPATSGAREESHRRPVHAFVSVTESLQPQRRDSREPRTRRGTKTACVTAI